MSGVPWKRLELAVLCIYALVFYLVVIRKSLRLSQGTPTLSLPPSISISVQLGITFSLHPQSTPGDSTAYEQDHSPAA
jgi:hypothetical protein